MIRCNVPGTARFVIVQRSPSLRLSFILPAHKRKISRYCGRGGSGSFKTEMLDVPDMMYTYDLRTQDFKMYIVERIDQSGLWLRDFRLANVHQGGAICWGGNTNVDFTDPRTLVATFWGSPFNDDLTPYPLATDEDWRNSPQHAEWRRIHEATASRREWVENAMQAYENDYHIWREAVERETERYMRRCDPLVDRATDFRRRIEALDATLNYLTERGLSSEHIMRKREGAARMLQRVNQMHHARITDQRRWEERVAAFERDGCQNMKAHFALLVVASSAEDKALARRRMIELARGMMNGHHRSLTPLNLPKRTVRGAILYMAIQQHLMYDRDNVQQYRDQFNMAWTATIRDRWWAGLWKIHGKVENYKHFIFGDRYEMYEDGCAGVLYFPHYENYSEFFTNPDGTRYNPSLPAVCTMYRVPNNEDVLAVVHGERPFILKRVGNHWTLKHYDERSRAVQEALTEIFG